MTINPQIASMIFQTLLQQALKATNYSATNVTNALQNGYDTGIMNDLYQNLYNQQASDGIDRYTGIDALNALNAQYGPRESIPKESAEDAFNVFKPRFDATTFLSNPEQLPELPEDNIIPGTQIPVQEDIPSWPDSDMDDIHSSEMWQQGNYHPNPELKKWYNQHKR